MAEQLHIRLPDGARRRIKAITDEPVSKWARGAVLGALGRIEARRLPGFDNGGGDSRLSEPGRGSGSGDPGDV